MKRVCFVLRVKQDLVEEYREAHDVWPEMRAALSEAGFRNYSLFMRPDGLIVGYFEAEDPQAALETLGKTEVNARWQKNMARFFSAGSGDLQKGGPEWLEEYFHLP